MKEITKYTTVLASASFLLLLTASDCKTVNNSGKVTPQPAAIDSTDCAAACANLERLQCPEGAPIDMGKSCKETNQCLGLDGKPDTKQYCGTNGHCMVTCTAFCIDTQNQGVWLDPTCVKNITSCEQLNSCPVPQKPGPTCAGPGCPPDIRTK